MCGQFGVQMVSLGKARSENFWYFGVWSLMVYTGVTLCAAWYVVFFMDWIFSSGVVLIKFWSLLGV